MMSQEEMHALEREALDDPFLQDAIDGYRLQQGVDSTPLSALQKRLANRVQERASERNATFFSGQRLAIGGVAAVLFVVAISLLFFRHLTHEKTRSTEIILMEHDFRLVLEPAAESDVTPLGGWASFKEELNSELKDFKDPQTLNIQFDVVNGAASGVVVEGASLPAVKQAVAQFLREKSRWKGQKAIFTLTVLDSPQ